MYCIVLYCNRLSLKELVAGMEVLCQNTSNNKWDRVGVIIECCGFRQYRIKLHGSGHITVQNRIHLRPVLTFKPVTAPSSYHQPENPNIQPTDTIISLGNSGSDTILSW